MGEIPCLARSLTLVGVGAPPSCYCAREERKATRKNNKQLVIPDHRDGRRPLCPQTVICGRNSIGVKELVDGEIPFEVFMPLREVM